MKTNLLTTLLFSLALGAFVSSCGLTKTDVSKINSETSDDFKDDDATAPSNISGSFIDFSCEAVTDSIACLVRYPGHTVSVPLGKLLKNAQPTMVGYLTPSISLPLEKVEANTSINAELEIDDTSEWGFQVKPLGTLINNDVITFLTANISNDDAGVLITFEEKYYNPNGDSTKRLHATIDRCLLGKYIKEWKQAPQNEKDITALPVSLSSLLSVASVEALLVSPSCQEKIASGAEIAAQFNSELAKLMTDYLNYADYDKEVLKQITQQIEDEK